MKMMICEALYGDVEGKFFCVFSQQSITLSNDFNFLIFVRVKPIDVYTHRLLHYYNQKSKIIH